MLKIKCLSVSQKNEQNGLFRVKSLQVYPCIVGDIFAPFQAPLMYTYASRTVWSFPLHLSWYDAIWRKFTQFSKELNFITKIKHLRNFFGFFLKNHTSDPLRWRTFPNAPRTCWPVPPALCRVRRASTLGGERRRRPAGDPGPGRCTQSASG